tara:strand:+ start:25711 stop:26061 length:351 start_codon:yes stop_codon:yes gene_type:complete
MGTVKEEVVNVDQADYVLAQMSVCWAGKPLTVEEVKFWVAKLENYEFDHAMDALSKIADKAKFWPSWAEFKEFVDIERRNNTPALSKPSEKPPCTKEEAAKHLAEARNILRQQRGV